MTTTQTHPNLPVDYRVLDFERDGFAAQDFLNHCIDGAHESDDDIETARRLLVIVAASQHAEHRQYDGHWDGPEWRLVRFTRHVVSKGGCRFAEGDYAIADLTPPALPFCEVGSGARTAYSVRGSVLVRVSPCDFEVVA